VVEQDFKAFSATGKNKTAPVEEVVDPNQVSDESCRLSNKGSPPSTSGKVRRPVSKEAKTVFLRGLFVTAVLEGSFVL
jgi:hypothetical protein